MRDPYLYPGSEVLRNLADIHDVNMLKNMEADYSSLRLSEIVVDDLESKYDFSALCDMHHYIFQDIYEWAGKPRVINIEKAEIVLGEISIEYSDCLEIMKDAEHVLEELNTYDWQSTSFENVVRTFSDYMAKLWKVHPYRDADVIIGTRLEKPSKINGFALLSPIFLSHAGWREDGAVHINTYYTKSQMGLCG